MLDPPGSLAIASAGLAVVALLNTRAIESIGRRLLHVKRTQLSQHDLYEDEDGVATEQSLKDYTATLRWLLYGTTLLTVAGIGISLSIAVLGTSGSLGSQNLRIENWLGAAAWVRSNAYQ
jgi:hypothetical protein